MMTDLKQRINNYYDININVFNLDLDEIWKPIEVINGLDKI